MRAAAISGSSALRRARCSSFSAEVERGVGCADETVPAPEIAFAADKALPGAELRDERVARVAFDEAALRETRHEFGGRLHQIAERRGAGRQGRAGVAVAGGPVDRRLRIGRGVEIIVQRGSERALEARRMHAIHHRRGGGGRDLAQQAIEAFQFGFQLADFPLGSKKRRREACFKSASFVDGAHGGGEGGLRGLCLGFGILVPRASFLQRGFQPGWIADGAEFGSGFLEVVGEARVALVLTAYRGLRGGGFGLGAGECGAALVRFLLEGLQAGHGGIDGGGKIGLPRRLRLRIVGRQGGERFGGTRGASGGVLALHGLAGQGLKQTRDVTIQPGDEIACGVTLAFKAGDLDLDHAQAAGDFSLGCAQGFDCGAGFEFGRRGASDSGDGFLFARLRGFERGARLDSLGDGAAPAGSAKASFEGGDLFGQGAILARLAGLALQRVGLLLHLGHDVGELGEVLVGGFQFEFGFVAAGGEAANAGGFFENAATVLRLGADQLADLALADEGGRVGAGGGIREQQLHVLGAHRAAVDLVGRARATTKHAADLDLVVFVELGRGGAIGVVEEKRDLRHLASGAGLGAGEDQVIHLAAAHGAGRGCAHGPAQRFEQVGLAAAVRADNARQALFDRHIHRIDEGLEARDLEADQVQAGSLAPGRRWRFANGVNPSPT